MLSWYALNSKPHSEKTVCEGLAARGIEAYLPAWEPPRRNSRSQSLIPFFPCYLFARVDLEVVGISSLQFLPGVRHLVFCGDRPARVPQAAVDQIRARLFEMKKNVTDALGQPLVPGDRVLITGGPLAGFEASFDCRLSSAERVRLLIDFVQTGAHMEIDRKLVRKSDNGNSSLRLPKRSLRYDAMRGGSL